MVDFSACANAEPVSRLEQLERENADFRTWGIIEIATRNPNVAEYMTHWEARAEKAEAENEALRARLQTVEAETRELRARNDPMRVLGDPRVGVTIDEASLKELKRVLATIGGATP